MLTIAQIQTLLAVSRSTVNRLIANRKLKAVKVGRCVRIPQESFNQFTKGLRTV